jgi:hypothetical protein
MTKAIKTLMIPDELVMNKIYMIRGQKVMLDKDLAELYGVTTGNLNLAVKRNKKRFPADFIFQLTKEEFENLILQNAISKSKGRGGTEAVSNLSLLLVWQPSSINHDLLQKYLPAFFLLSEIYKSGLPLCV